MADKAWKKSRASLVEKILDGGTADALTDDFVKQRAVVVFKEIDSDGNGKIDQPELKSAMAKIGVELSDKEVKTMVQEADEDG